MLFGAEMLGCCLNVVKALGYDPAASLFSLVSVHVMSTTVVCRK